MARSKRSNRFKQNKHKPKNQPKHKPAHRVPDAPAAAAPTRKERSGLSWLVIAAFWIGLIGLAAYPQISAALGWSTRRAPAADTTTPVIEITAPAADAVIAAVPRTEAAASAPDSWRLQVRTRVQDDGAGQLEVSVRAAGVDQGAAEPLGDGVFTKWVTISTAGPQAIEVTAKDAAGNSARASIQVQCGKRPGPG